MSECELHISDNTNSCGANYNTSQGQRPNAAATGSCLDPEELTAATQSSLELDSNLMAALVLGQGVEEPDGQVITLASGSIRRLRVNTDRPCFQL